MYKGRFWTDERATTCGKMLLAGATYYAIAAAIGTSRNAVAGFIKRTQPERPARPARKADEQPIPTRTKRRKMHDDGERVAPMPMPEPVAGGVATVDLTARQCRFVLSAEAPWHHCGARTPLGSAWCPQHREQVYQRAKREDVA